MKIAIEVTPFTKLEAGIYRYGLNLVRALKRVQPPLVITPFSVSLLMEVPPTNPMVFEELFGEQAIPFFYHFIRRDAARTQGELVRLPHFFQQAYHRHHCTLKNAGKGTTTASRHWLKFKREFHRAASTAINFARDIPYQEITRQYVDADTIILHTLYDALPVDLGRHRPQVICQTVHDIIPLLFAPSHHRGFDAIMDSARRADLLIVISESTKQDLLTLEGFRSENIEVIPLAADPVFHPSTEAEVCAIRLKAGIPDGMPYFLSVSTVEPRKNFAFLLRAFKTFILTPGAIPCRLILTGAGGWGNTMEEISPLLEELKDHVHYLGFVSDQELAALYTGAETFLFPSLYEGFGLPVLEAMACGANVICSNTSSLPEVAGDAGVLLSPHDEQPWVDAMKGALRRTNEERELNRSKAISRANLFSWEKNAAHTLEAYKRALARKGHATAQD